MKKIFGQEQCKVLCSHKSTYTCGVLNALCPQFLILLACLLLIFNKEGCDEANSIAGIEFLFYLNNNFPL